MKNATTYLMILLFAFSPFAINATETDPPKTVTELPAEVQALVNRIEEIKEMDKSEMSSSERKELRKESRALKAEARASGSGLYLSAGAIIIILILIIIL